MLDEKRCFWTGSFPLASNCSRETKFSLLISWLEKLTWSSRWPLKDRPCFARNSIAKTICHRILCSQWLPWLRTSPAGNQLCMWRSTVGTSLFNIAHDLHGWSLNWRMSLSWRLVRINQALWRRLSVLPRRPCGDECQEAIFAELFKSFHYVLNMCRYLWFSRQHSSETDPGEGLRGVQTPFEQHLFGFLFDSSSTKKEIFFTKLTHFHHSAANHVMKR